MKKVKVFTDNVHGDIWLTKTEIDIIDTPEFQRLQYILQLGPTYLVYRGATHTRFSHSLGTLFMSQRMIDAINTNYRDFREGYEIEPDAIFLTRICALLHDVVYLTNDHIFESEGNIFGKKQWEDDQRVSYFIRRDESEIRKALFNNITKEFGVTQGTEKFSKLIEEFIKIMQSGKQISMLERPYISDIVQNTICADLLDYLKRDTINTGIRGSYGERFITYLTIQDYKDDTDQTNKKRVVIKLYKRDIDDLRNDVISEILDVLRLRYTLGEKVYFHHTKQAASAMLIKLFSGLLYANIINLADEIDYSRKEFLFKLDDYSLVYYARDLKEDNYPNKYRKYIKMCNRIANDILNRKTYKKIHEETNLRQNESAMNRIKEMRNWKLRFDFENQLDKLIQAELGSIIIHCPQEEMSLKEGKVLVKTKLPIMMLEDLGKKTEFKLTIGDELELLKNKHRNLWRLTVFASPKIKNDKDKYSKLKAMCEQWFSGETPVSIVECVCNIENFNPLEGLTIYSSNITSSFETDSQKQYNPEICEGTYLCDYIKADIELKRSNKK